MLTFAATEVNHHSRYTMHKALDQLDLNLLRLLAMLVKTGNSQATARRLGISQPSVSRGLAKLREVFGAELFLRKPQGLSPSPLALELAERIERMLDPLEDVLLRHVQFEPHSYNGTIKLVVDRGLLNLLGSQLIGQLTRALPEANICLVGWSGSGLRRLQQGEYDYGLQYNLFPFPKTLCTPELLTQPIGCVALRDHPAFNGDIDLQRICHYPLVRFYLPLTNTLDFAEAEKYLERQGLQFRMQLVTDDLYSLMAFIREQQAIWPSGIPLAAQMDDDLVFHRLANIKPIKLHSVYQATRKNQPLYNFLDKTIQYLLLKPKDNNNLLG